MARALLECTAGYSEDAVALLRSALFTESSDSLVVVGGIQFFSLCEHHVLPFFGKIHIGYLPNGRVVGLSKLARAAQAIARRLQVQERITADLADAVQEATGARGVAVIIDAELRGKLAREDGG